MDINARNAHVYIGRDAGQPVLEAMVNTKKDGSIDIISPYLSKEYVSFLLKKQAEGVTINLVTSSDFAKNAARTEISQLLVKQKAERIPGAHGKIKRFRYYALALFALAAAAGYAHLALNPKITGTLLFAGIAAVASIVFFAESRNVRLFSYSYSPTLNLAVYKTWHRECCPDGYFMHAKAFVINQVNAYVGSLNLTRAGFGFNMEVRADLQDSQAAQQLSGHIRAMVADPFAPVLTVEEIGKSIYFEKAR